MGLFTDGAIATIEDLNGHDTQLLNVATIEGIDVTRKLGLAQEVLRIELEGLLGGLSSMNSMNSMIRPPAIEQVVVTPALKLWGIFRALEMVYRDAYNSQLNDRYAGKRDEYLAMTSWAYEEVVRGGLGIASDPVKRAAFPDVAPVSGGLADGTYFVAVTWLNAAGEEGASSEPAMITISGSSFGVQTTTPENVRGWNVYCGTSASTMTLQNTLALSIGTTWVQPSSVKSSGQATDSGQAPNYRLAVPRIIQRG